MKGKKPRILSLCGVIVAAIISAVALPATVAGATITVPDDYSTIQAAIIVASSGDTVYVRAGTYSPSTNGEVFPINMRNGISLVGAGADVCILDAENTNCVIYCNGITDTTTIIEGFSIINGGIYYYIGDLGIGGGIVCQFESSPIIINNTFTGNSTEYSSGITCESGSSPIITKNIIAGNFPRAGAGIFCIGTSPIITNNIITGNSGTYFGGIVGWPGSSPTITNNTVSGNSAVAGGGVLADEPGTTITNNIITGNSASGMGGGIAGESGPGATITYNDVWDNSPVDYYNCVPGAGCISADPLFVDPTVGDYHLQPESLCIDVGDNFAPGLPDFDFDGNPRKADGDGDGNDVVDMGAFEFQGDIEATIDIDPDSLNLKSKGKWITAYIELPEGYDVADIDVSTFLLNDTVPSEPNPTAIGDYDDDGIPDLMVKFNRSDVSDILNPGDEVEVTITGELKDGTKFEGTDTIKVINEGE